MVGDIVGVGAAFLAGVLTFLSPCVLPLIPVFLTFVTGVSFEELSASASPDGGTRSQRRTTLLHVTAFILGFSFVFVLLGASATFLGRVLFSHQEWFLRGGGVLIVLFGFLMMGLLPVGFLQKDFRVHLRQKPAGLAGSFLVGAVFGFGWTPCVGPILGSILLLASSSDSVRQGMFLLAVYSLGLALPFLAAALLFNGFLRFFRKIRWVMVWLERAAGAFMVLVGVLVAFGQFSRLTGWMLQAFEPWVDWLIRLGI
ncbi:MAG TPA: cytochrome c biogenesis protein CcdA [Elusimicrobiota bacterium]|nr:cytochrome c biogenesis protein CcdA [Elusimicrobiota bacterium]